MPAESRSHRTLRCFLALFVFAAIGPLSPWASRAQESSHSVLIKNAREALRKAKKETQSESGLHTLLGISCSSVADPEAQKDCWQAERAAFLYNKYVTEHNESIFFWQHMSTRIIFFVVLSLVGTGIYFAWVQFHSGDRSQTHVLEISLQGIKVTSPFLGLVILTLSLAFFYLYLVYVYPIKDLM